MLNRSRRVWCISWCIFNWKQTTWGASNCSIKCSIRWGIKVAKTLWTSLGRKTVQVDKMQRNSSLKQLASLWMTLPTSVAIRIIIQCFVLSFIFRATKSIFRVWFNAWGSNSLTPRKSLFHIGECVKATFRSTPTVSGAWFRVPLCCGSNS